MKHFGIKTLLLILRSPNYNIIEKYNQNLVQLLRIYVHKYDSQWYRYIYFIADSLNINYSTKFSSKFLHLEIRDNFWLEHLEFALYDSDKSVHTQSIEYKTILHIARQKMINSCNKNKLWIDRNKKFTYFKENDL